MSSKEQNNQPNEKKNKTVKKVASKPEYSQFIQELKTKLEDKNIKIPVTNVFNFIKKGFQEKITQEHINEIALICFPWRKFSLLAIKILLDISTQRASSLFKLLSQKIREEMAKQTEFPSDQTPLFTNVADSERRDILERWVFAHKKNGYIEYLWAQKAIACLLEFNKYEMHYNDLAIVEYIVESCLPPKKKGDKKGDEDQKTYLKYVKELVKPFLSKALPKRKIFFAQTFIQYKSYNTKHQKEEILNLREQLEHEQSKSQNLNSKLEETKEELDRTISERDNVKALLNEKEKALQKEQERYHVLENYWQKESSNILGRKIMSIKRDFEHEIREARLSLDRDNPNIKMALSRIRNMEDYISKIEESE